MSQLSSTEFEKSVLSSLWQEPERFIPQALSEGLTESTFTLPVNQRIFRMIQDRTKEGRPMDLLTVTEELIAANSMEDYGGAYGITTTAGFAPTPCHFSYHLGKILEMAALRAAIQHANSIEAAAESGEAQKVMDIARDAAESLARAITRRKRAKSGKEACREWFDRWQALRNGDEEPGISSGLLAIDEVTGGLKPGELWVASGKTSGGKSVLALQFAASAIVCGQRAAVFSLEMGASEVASRLISCIGGIEISKLTDPNRFISPSDGMSDMSGRGIRTITKVVSQITNSRMEVIDEAGLSLDAIEAIAAQLHDVDPLGMIVVDYIQLVQGRRRDGDTREREIASISAGLKQLAKKLGCPVVALSQLNDAGRLRESRAIGQDADVVLKIQEDGINVDKNRNGARDQLLSLYLDGLYQRFGTTRPQSHEDGR